MKKTHAIKQSIFLDVYALKTYIDLLKQLPVLSNFVFYLTLSLTVLSIFYII